MSPRAPLAATRALAIAIALALVLVAPALTALGAAPHRSSALGARASSAQRARTSHACRAARHPLRDLLRVREARRVRRERACRKHHSHPHTRSANGPPAGGQAQSGSGNGGSGPAPGGPSGQPASGGGSSTDPSGAPPPAHAPPPVPHVLVTAAEWSFSLSSTTVPAGKVVIQFANHGQDEHNLNLETEASLAGSLSNTLPEEVRQLTLEMGAGAYTLFCSLPEHERRGMKATLVVE